MKKAQYIGLRECETPAGCGSHTLKKGRSFPLRGALCGIIRLPMANALKIIVSVLMACSSANAQTIAITPPELTRVPVSELGSGRYWQQLLVVFAQDDAPSDTTLSIGLPVGVTVADTDADSLFTDELRLVYVPVADETPGFFVGPNTVANTLAVGSQAATAAGGQLYLQFPVAIAQVPPFVVGTDPLDAIINYGPIVFADEREVDLVDGPEATLVTQAEFNSTGSMNLIALGPALALADEDTMTSALGTVYPEAEEVLALVLPDLVFDGGISTASNAVGLGDGDDANDVEYRFFLSSVGNLTVVDETTAREALMGVGDTYVEREGDGRATNLLFRDVVPGTYYLYATSSITGTIPLVRSRGIAVRHEPVFQRLGPETTITLDSGDLLDATGAATGSSIGEVDISFALIDHDSEPPVHLFYSVNGELDQTSLTGDGAGGLTLAEGVALTAPEGLVAKADTVVWDILTPELIPAGDYFIYAAATDLVSTGLIRSAGQVRVRHAPFLRLDPLNDGVVGTADTIVTGGSRPQRFVSFTWGRRGFDGDADIDDDAKIDLYLSQLPATTTIAEAGFAVPGGGDQVLVALTSGQAQLIIGNIAEDPDERVDNQYVWDLWSLAGSGSGVPEAGVVHYAYGVISDGDSRRLEQMNGGRLNDAASQLVFLHPPSIRALQPVAPISVEPGRSGRVGWEDMDLDDDARIRVLLSREDRGAVSTYAAVASGVSYVVNSADGRAEVAVDSLLDLSEDSTVDHLEVRIDHLTRAVTTDDPLAEGDYFIYLAITDTGDFAEAMAVRAPGLVQVLGLEGEATALAPIQLLPEVFSMGTGGQLLTFEVRINAGTSVDLVQATFVADPASFLAVDQNPLLEGVQPFVVGSGFQAAKLVTNNAVDDGFGALRLSMGYFEPTVNAIAGLGSNRVLATFQLQSLDQVGAVSIGLEVETATGQASRLELDGQAVSELTSGPASAGELVAGRATVMGTINLEGRQDMTAQVDFFLRRWGAYDPVVDEVFSLANDSDAARDGVQVAVAADGSFVLTEVPTGRWDLHARLSGYLQAWVPGIELFPAQIVEGVQPASPGSGERPRMLGGDVTGYLGLDGSGSQDNEVTLADWDFVAAFFGLEAVVGSASGRADISGDGAVNIQDLSLVGANFRRSGPVPVYKTTVATGEQWVKLIGPDHDANAATEVEYIVVGSGLVGMRAYELNLEYDPAQWQWVGTEFAKDKGLMGAERHQGGRLLSGASQLGRGGDLAGVETLLKWRLQALRNGAEAPTIQRASFIDQQHRAIAVAINNKPQLTPTAFALAQNIPNPFNPETSIDFTVPLGGGPLRLEIFDMLGRHVAVLWDGEMAPGQHRLHWRGLDQEGRSVASGIYIYRLQSRTQRLAKRMVLVR